MSIGLKSEWAPGASRSRVQYPRGEVTCVTVRVRPALAGCSRYLPGNRLAPAPPHKLSSNENPYPPLPGVLAATAQACAQMNRYPDMANSAVTEAVAARLRVDQSQLAFAQVRSRCSMRCCRRSANPAMR